jgi:hypothetical protein
MYGTSTTYRYTDTYIVTACGSVVVPVIALVVISPATTMNFNSNSLKLGTTDIFIDDSIDVL